MGKLMEKLMGGPPQLPLLAIFPGNAPNKPLINETIVYSVEDVKDLLGRAGPSVSYDGPSGEGTLP